MIAAASFSATAVIAECDCEVSNLTDELDERDFEALIEYVNSKRTITLQEKACNLSISGDIRAEWQHIREKQDGDRRRGGGATDCSGVDPAGRSGGARIGNNDFDVEFNLYFDYKCDRTWGVAQLQFDNSMGIKGSNKISPTQGNAQANAEGVCKRTAAESLQGSGTCDSLCLRRAYWGYNVCADGCSRFDIEVGRRRLYDVFDSRVQFQSFFDGVLLRYATQVDCCADAYINFGAFVVDERSNHFGWVIEGGLLNLCDSGFDVKYSFIDWKKDGHNRFSNSVQTVRKSKGSRFQVHQLTGAYHLEPEVLCMPAKLYGAVLWNSAAEKGQARFNNKRENAAWYLGFLVGEVCREGDWALDINYQYVEAQAVPNEDVGGIGRGNVLNENPYQTDVAANCRGNANYQGVHIEGLYAITDNLSVDATFEYARSAEKSIGGPLNYSKWKVATIYAF